MANTDRYSGRTSYVTISTTGSPFTLPITKIDPKIVRKLGDSTDTGDYNEAQDMVAQTQIPCTYRIEGTMEGRFRASSTPLNFIAPLMTSVTQLPITIGLSAAAVWGSGLCDISDFATSIPVDDVVSWTASFVSWGEFTPNA